MIQLTFFLVKGLGKKIKYQKTPLLLMNDPSLLLMIGGKRKVEWGVDNHSSFPCSFRKSVETLYLFLKRNFFETGLKIPKFVVYEIVKRAI